MCSKSRSRRIGAFIYQDGVFTAGSTDATLNGNLYLEFGGTPIEGTDIVCIVPASDSTATLTTSANITVDSFLYLPAVTR